MNVQVAKLPQSQVSLDIEVDSSAVGSAIERAYQSLSQRVNVPGFRKGKAPRAVLERTIGHEAVLEEAADIAINDAYRQALEETDLEPLTAPDIDLQGNGIDPSQPLFFTAKFYVRPEVHLGDYQSIRVAPPKTVVDDAAVDAMLKRMSESQAPWESVESGTAEAGDVAVIQLAGAVEGEVVIEEREQELYISPDDPLDSDMPNLVPHIIGMAAGESRDFDVTLPKEFEPAQYAEKIMASHVELKRLERRAIPAIDDSFAQGVGEFDSLAALREHLRSSLEAQQRIEDADQFVVTVTQQAVDSATVEIPPPLVEDEIHRTLDNFKAELEGRQHLTLDLYLRLTNKTMEQLHEDVREPSEQRVKSNLVLEAIADAEGISAPTDEIDVQLGELVSLSTVRDRDRRRILTSPSVRARVETRLKRRLALQRLLQIANPIEKLADTTSVEASEHQVIQHAAESHADALESPLHQASEEEIEV